ncbi:hypothetical protein [Polymorphospora rubra]|uniref:Uncharacterized protein n=1 Tax=Polymorphospora rubra TaxID=338584 RepID=A0A810MX39_9ACTN|nr:hypothetical protein [Polymorphospora rubra]BCJ65120.1 hypothetical protein Prubr_21410 [Polymorphospora rubra]
MNPAEMRASERLAAALGRPAPEPLTPEELAEFEAQQDRVDAALLEAYGNPNRTDGTPVVLFVV